ncbi:hypothetical protein [Nocardioides bigeumensis]|uniref:WD40 repeat domain-containing protein n=1 Tax=Nocardioides bigeumensis TaxID=433657 RepID=A0ABP5JG51_9ACTN
MRLRHLLPSVLAALTLPFAAPVTVVHAAAAAAPTITVDPTELSRGEDASIPMIRNGRIVDGDRTLPLPAPNAVMVGRSGDGFVVWSSQDARTPKVWRVDGDGSATMLLRSQEAYATVLATEGDRLVVPKTRIKARETLLTVHDAMTGAVQEQTTVPGFASVLDVADGVGVVGSTNPARTWRWDLGTGLRERLAKDAGYKADLSTDRLAVFDADPFRGGCSVVSSLSDPSSRLSRSCTERVDEFSPDGRRMALVDLLADGLGPNRVIVRSVSGRRLVTYDAPYYFGMVTWERARTLLLQTHTTKRTALVRCVRTECERASKLGPAPDLRPSVTNRLMDPLAPWLARPATRS